MDATKIKAIIIAVLATFAALYLGITAATAQFETISWVLGGLTLVVCLLLGKRIWLLIPFLGALGFTFRIPGQPTSMLIAQGLFIGFAMLLFLTRKLPFSLRFTELEIWIAILVLLVIQVYARNPTGLNIFGGESVGAKAYVIFAIAVVSSLLLSGLRVPPKELALIFPLTVIGGLLNFVSFTVGYFVPQIGVWYGAVSATSNETPSGPETDQATRIGFVRGAATNFALWLSCRISPLRALLHPFWLMMLLASLVFAALSGYRNTVAAVGLTYLCGLIYRGGFIQIVISIMGAVLGLALLAMVNLMHPLPANIQRSLSFLPGTWEDRYVMDATASTDWRVELWNEVLFTDRWIQNKWLGDGLGFTAKELRTQLELSDMRYTGKSGISGFDLHRETILATGDYHSGPVQTIRTIGYVGLAALLLAMIRLAVHAHRQILRCRGTEWFPLALLIGIPLVWAPIFFTFIFGSFQIGASGFLLGAAMVRMLENNLPLPAYVAHRRHAHIPLPMRKHTRNVTA